MGFFRLFKLFGGSRADNLGPNSPLPPQLPGVPVLPPSRTPRIPDDASDGQPPLDLPPELLQRTRRARPIRGSFSGVTEYTMPVTSAETREMMREHANAQGMSMLQARRERGREINAAYEASRPIYEGVLYPRKRK
jgi:hypothetical protein